MAARSRIPKELLILDLILVHIACVVLAVMVWGRAEPPPPSQLTAERFDILDKNGESTGRFASTSSGSELVLESTDGTSAALYADKESSQLVLATPTTEVRVEATPTKSRIRLGGSTAWIELSSDGKANNSLVLRTPNRRTELSTGEQDEVLVIEALNGKSPKLVLSSSEDAMVLTVTHNALNLLTAKASVDDVVFQVGNGPHATCWRASSDGAEPCAGSAEQDSPPPSPKSEGAPEETQTP
ncbi:MAG: hypothetical protein CO108_26995 [Deltaproteobacteria bacterium CG_4_9_14_3_um_filter_63_12]|nr:MAG: hypothetical protein CO108_26995 [Deltaproteobacteria bacterium CG_4_9_14_3_um_filter_63_12]